MTYRMWWRPCPRRTLALPLVQALLCFAFWAVGTDAYALAFGPLRVLSAAGQPLRAEVDLLDVRERPISVRALPPSEERDRYPDSDLLVDIKAQVRQLADGRSVVQLSSAHPFTRAVLRVSLQVDDGDGVLARDFTLRPAPSASAGTAPTEATSTASGRDAMRSSRPIPAAGEFSAATVDAGPRQPPARGSQASERMERPDTAPVVRPSSARRGEVTSAAPRHAEKVKPRHRSAVRHRAPTAASAKTPSHKPRQSAKPSAAAPGVASARRPAAAPGPEPARLPPPSVPQPVERTAGAASVAETSSQPVPSRLVPTPAQPIKSPPAAAVSAATRASPDAGAATVPASGAAASLVPSESRAAASAPVEASAAASAAASEAAPAQEPASAAGSVPATMAPPRGTAGGAPEDGASGSGPWWWIALGLAALSVLAWLLLRRRLRGDASRPAGDRLQPWQPGPSFGDDPQPSDAAHPKSQQPNAADADADAGMAAAVHRVDPPSHGDRVGDHGRDGGYPVRGEKVSGAVGGLADNRVPSGQADESADAHFASESEFSDRLTQAQTLLAQGRHAEAADAAREILQVCDVLEAELAALNKRIGKN